MYSNTRIKKQPKRQWMTEFERISIEKPIYLPGKVDWKSAEYFYSTGLTAEQAVNKIVLTRGIL